MIKHIACTMGIGLLWIGSLQAAVSTTFQPSSGFWGTAANWDEGLPGQTRTAGGATNDRGQVIAGVTAHQVSAAPVPLSPYDVWVGDGVLGGTLNVSANMTGLREVRVGGMEDASGVWTQTAGALDAESLLVGAALGSGTAVFKLSGGSFMTSGNAVLEATGTLRVWGADPLLAVGNNLTVNGALEIRPGRTGLNGVEVGGAFTVDAANARLTVGMSDYMGGPRTIELVRFTSLSGSFNSDNIAITGLRPGQTASIAYDADSMNLVITVAPESASRLWFSQTALAGTGTAVAGDLILNNGRFLADLDVPGLTCIRSSDGDDLVYAVSWTGNDYDGDGVNDTLSFELRVEGFTGSTFAYSANAGESSMTALGASADVTDTNNNWGVFGDYDVDEGESLRFSVTNLQVSAAGFTAEFDGFYGMETIETNGGHSHLMVLGSGAGLDSREFDTTTAQLEFPAVNPFVVTGAGSFYSTRQWAVSGIDFKVRVYNPTNSAAWDVTDYSEFVTGPGYGHPYPAQASTLNFPEFSWEKIPRWLIIRKASAYTDAEVDSMATNFELVVFEKANKAGFATIEEGILDTAARIREIDPTTKNIFYWNSLIHYGGYGADTLYEPNAWEWSNRTIDANGTEVIDWFKDSYYAHNYSVPAMRDWWVNTALGMAANSAIDGVFIDKVGGGDVGAFIDGKPSTSHLEMMVALREGLPEGKLFLGNTLRNERTNGNRAHMTLEDGSYLERWALPDTSSTPGQSTADATAVSIQLMREALAKGKIILFKTEGDGTSQETLKSTVDYPLAIFLTVAETNAYFAYQADVDATHASWLWDTSYVPGFNRPLGRPLGDPVKNGYVYTRSFEHVDVRVDVSTQQAVLTWTIDADQDGLADEWELAHFGSVFTQDGSGDPDGDSLNNTAEFALGGNPMNDVDSGIRPELTSDTGGLQFTYRRRRNAAELGLTYTVQTTDDFTAPVSWGTSGVTETGTTLIDADFESVANSISIDGEPRKFIRLRIGGQ